MRTEAAVRQPDQKRSPVKRAWLVFAGTALVVGFAASVAPGLGAFEDAAGWLWAHPVALMAIATVALSLLSFFLGARAFPRSLSPRHQAADNETFEKLVELIPRHVIDFLKHQDFGNGWRGDLTEPIYMYVETRNAVEHEFHDRVLEAKRRRLHAACKVFAEKLAGYSAPAEHPGYHFELNEKSWVRSHPPGDETYQRFEAHRGELGELADAVVDAYDDLIRVARQRVA